MKSSKINKLSFNLLNLVDIIKPGRLKDRALYENLM